MAVAAVFISGQTDYKRMLAYSSVEHMGILAVGVGLGGAAVFAAVLHVINHSLTKAMLFLVAGNLLAVYRTKNTGGIAGALSVMPVSGALWLLGLFAITGSPPFGPFLSEFTILKAALDQGQTLVALVYLAILAVILAAMAAPALAMVQGMPSEHVVPARSRSAALNVVPAMLGIVVFVLGVYVPPVLTRALRQAAHLLG